MSSKNRKSSKDQSSPRVIPRTGDPGFRKTGSIGRNRSAPGRSFLERRTAADHEYDARMADPTTRRQALVSRTSVIVALCKLALSKGDRSVTVPGVGGCAITITGRDEIADMARRCEKWLGVLTDVFTIVDEIPSEPSVNDAMVA